MTRVRVEGFAISLDGYGAVPSQDIENPLGIEIKKSASPGKDAVRHFIALELLKLPIGPGRTVSPGSQRLPITESYRRCRWG